MFIAKLTRRKIFLNSHSNERQYTASNNDRSPNYKFLLADIRFFQFRFSLVSFDSFGQSKASASPRPKHPRLLYHYQVFALNLSKCFHRQTIFLKPQQKQNRLYRNLNRLRITKHGVGFASTFIYGIFLSCTQRLSSNQNNLH